MFYICFMKKFLFILSFLLSGSLFSQNFNKGLEIIHRGIDTTYFMEGGLRWTDFSLTPRKYFKVMDLIESDTTCGCLVIKGDKPYITFVKDRGMYHTKEDRNFHKKFIGYMECRKDEYDIFMWVGEHEAFGFMTTYTMD